MILKLQQLRSCPKRGGNNPVQEQCQHHWDQQGLWARACWDSQTHHPPPLLLPSLFLESQKLLWQQNHGGISQKFRITRLGGDWRSPGPTTNHSIPITTPKPYPQKDLLMENQAWPGAGTAPGSDSPTQSLGLPRERNVLTVQAINDT